MTFYFLDKHPKSDRHDLTKLLGASEAQKRFKVFQSDFSWHVEDQNILDYLETLLGAFPLARRLDAMPDLAPEDEALLVYRDASIPQSLHLPGRSPQPSENWKFALIHRSKRR